MKDREHIEALWAAGHALEERVGPLVARIFALESETKALRAEVDALKRIQEWPDAGAG